MSEAANLDLQLDRTRPDGVVRKHLEGLDWLLLCTLGPIFLVCFGLHATAVINDSLLYHAFYVSSAKSATDVPTVAGFILEYENSGELQVGDRILRIGDDSTVGANTFEVSALTLGKARQGRSVPMEIERDGVRHSITLSLSPPQVPWARIPLLLGFAVVAVIVLWRSPGSAPTRLMFMACINLAIFQSVFTGPSTLGVYAGIFMFQVWGVISIVTIGLWVIRFPPHLDPKDRRHWALTIPPALLWSLPRFTQYLGGPLPLRSLSMEMFVVDVVILACLLGALNWNYRCASAVGRRQVKWAMLGAYLGLMPYIFVATLVALNPDLVALRLLHALAVTSAALMPVGFLVAIARYNLFDIDRVISGTASYTLVLILLALLSETMLEPFAALFGKQLGFDPSSSQLVFVGVMTFAVIPMQRAWRPYVDRLFFAGGSSRTSEIEQLIEELPSVARIGGDVVTRLVCERLEAIFGSTFCVEYQLRGDGFEPSFSVGDAQPQPLLGEHRLAIARVLGKRISPLQLDSRGRGREDPAIAEGLHAALYGLDAALLIPLRPKGALSAFLCLGPKQSRDVYTPADLSLLTSVAHHTSEELSSELDR